MPVFVCPTGRAVSRLTGLSVSVGGFRELLLSACREISRPGSLMISVTPRNLKVVAFNYPRTSELPHFSQQRPAFVLPACHTPTPHFLRGPLLPLMFGSGHGNSGGWLTWRWLSWVSHALRKSALPCRLVWGDAIMRSGVQEEPSAAVMDAHLPQERLLSARAELWLARCDKWLKGIVV